MQEDYKNINSPYQSNKHNLRKILLSFSLGLSIGILIAIYIYYDKSECDQAVVQPTPDQPKPISSEIEYTFYKTLKERTKHVIANDTDTQATAEIDEKKDDTTPLKQNDHSTTQETDKTTAPLKQNDHSTAQETAKTTAPLKQNDHSTAQETTKTTAPLKQNDRLTAQETAKTTAPLKQNDRLTAQETAKTTAINRAPYIIQVGSFKDQQAAENLRAKLTLLNISPKIERAGNLHRVKLGPYQTVEQLQKIKDILIKNNIEFILSK